MYRKKTLRHSMKQTRQFLKILNDLESVLVRLKNFALKVDRMEFDQKALQAASAAYGRTPKVEANIPLFSMDDESFEGVAGELATKGQGEGSTTPPPTPRGSLEQVKGQSNS